MKRSRLKYRSKPDRQHTDYFVEIEGMRNPDGTPCRFSMDANTFAKHKFMIGQKITPEEAGKLALALVGGSRARLWRLCQMAHQIGPGGRIEITDE